MIINHSQLSMDASTGHKDVSRTADGRYLNRNHAGRTEPHFTLTLPKLEQLGRTPSGRITEERITTRSTAESLDGTQDQRATDSFLSRMIGSITGSEARIRALDSDLFSRQLGRSREIPTMERRFYRIGGQQFSLHFSAHRFQYEYEYYRYNSEGTVQTADGRQLSFSLELSVERTTVVRQSLFAGLQSGYLIDPLVLHFDGGMENLFEQPFQFDLTGDGTQELVPGLCRGSGYLALDQDGDGAITSGRELFGPLSGSGFADLARHDQDRNRWIDENDPIFDQLLIWMNPSGGDQKLVSLREAGVGAISLSHTDSLYNLKSAANDILGQVSGSGIFLTEDGEVRSLQDLNLHLPEASPGAMAAARLRERLHDRTGAERSAAGGRPVFFPGSFWNSREDSQQDDSG